MTENMDCNKVRMSKSLAYPRTCKVCGLGPCKYDESPAQHMPLAITINDMESADKRKWSIRIGKTINGRTMADVLCDGKIVARKVIDPNALKMGAMLLGATDIPE
jgi:hypothetical protein